METTVKAHKRQLVRRRNNRFAYPERRTGFDRRLAGETGLTRLCLYLANRRATFWKALIAINALSVLDLLLTLNLMKFGIVTEGNPVLAGLIQLDPIAALAFKISLIMMITLVFWRFRRYRHVILATASTLALFTVLVGYQLVLHAMFL
jgi:hypothetical protein